MSRWGQFLLAWANVVDDAAGLLFGRTVTPKLGVTLLLLPPLLLCCLKNYFFLAKFTKRQNITKKGRLPTVELKPCLYKKRCKRAQSIQAWTLIVCILYVEINHLYENVRTKTHQVGNMYTTERRRKNDDKVESNYYFVGEKNICVYR